MPRVLHPVSLLACLAFVAAACEYDPTDFDGPLGECAGVDATHGFGFNGNEDPAGGVTYDTTAGNDVVVVANGPTLVRTGAGHDLICANPFDAGAGVIVDAGPGIDDCHQADGVTYLNCELIDGVPVIDTVNDALGRGINLGNMLEAPREGDWGLVLNESYFATIAAEGFTHVRVPISWEGYAATTAPFSIPTDNDPTIVRPEYDSIFERVDWVVDQADANGLIAIVNMHHYDAIHDDPTGQTPRFLAMWDQIATHYADAGNHVLFELLNEPHGEFDTEPALWNTLLADGLDVIRQSNPQRPVLVGPVGYNTIERLDELTLPADPHLITTVHFYDPFPFTHQGATWTDPPLATGIEWFGNTTDFTTFAADYSWDTDVTSTQGALLVNYTRQWAGFSPRINDPIDPASYTFESSGAATLVAKCSDPADDETDLGLVTTTATAATYTLDLSTCPPDTVRVSLLHADPGTAQLAVTSAEICSASECIEVISSAAESIAAAIADAAEWGVANGRPMHVGEFGAFSANGEADLTQRAAWTAAVQQAAVTNDMSSSYWEFGAGFGAYDLDADQWVAQIRDALLN